MGELIDYPSLHACGDASALYINSSFGYNFILGQTFGIAPFPMTAWGINVEWNIAEWLKWQSGAFDAPYQFDENPYNVRWNFNSDKGTILSSEFIFATTLGHHLEGSYRVGGVYQTALDYWEMHTTMEQQLLKRNNRNLTAFAMAVYSPKGDDNYANFAA